MVRNDGMYVRKNDNERHDDFFLIVFSSLVFMVC